MNRSIITITDNMLINSILLKYITTFIAFYAMVASVRQSISGKWYVNQSMNVCVKLGCRRCPGTSSLV